MLLSFYEWGIYSVPLRTPIISTLTMEPNSPKAIERALGQTVSFYGVTSAWVVGGDFCSDSSNGAHQGYKHSASHPCMPRTTPLPPCPSLGNLGFQAGTPKWHKCQQLAPSKLGAGDVWAKFCADKCKPHLGCGQCPPLAPSSHPASS